MVLTPDIKRIVEAIAKKIAGGTQDYEDCLQEGLAKVLELPVGGKRQFYLTCAKNKMFDYLRKENSYKRFRRKLEGDYNGY